MKHDYRTIQMHMHIISWEFYMYLNCKHVSIWLHLYPASMTLEDMDNPLLALYTNITFKLAPMHIRTMYILININTHSHTYIVSY